MAQIREGDIVEAEVTKITDFGAFVIFNGRNFGLIHISQIANSFVKDINEYLKVGDKVKARVIKLRPRNKFDLSLKIKTEPFWHPGENKKFQFKTSDFEEKLEKFLK